MSKRNGAEREDELFLLAKEIYSLIAENRYAQAKALIKSERKEYPKSQSHRFLAFSAVLHEALGAVDTSIALMRQALREKPAWLPHLHRLSGMLMDVERWDEAEILLNEIVTLSLAQNEFYFLNDSRYRRAVCLHRLGRMAEFKRARAEIPPGTRIFLDDKHCEIDEFLG
jgi:tetratricopeptide (TPR) repeat protein